LKDDSLEVIEILRESYKKDPKKNKKNIKTLDELDVDTVSQIYLFFDYDGHATNADDDKINNALQFFHDETDKGKLFISYPMVEALKHISEEREFKSETAVSESEYKDLVSNQTDYEDLRKLSMTDWDFISSENLKKANLIVHDTYEESEELLEQEEIFECQLTKYIEPSNKVAVLSAFPLFLRDYFGATTLKKIFKKL